MREFLIELPIWLSTGVLTLIVAIGAGLVPIWIRSRIPHENIRHNNEVAGFVYSVMGIIYGIVLGFVVLMVYENYRDADKYVETEAAQLADIYRFSYKYPEPIRSRLQTGLIAYARSVVENEWALMAQGKHSHQTHQLLHALWEDYLSFEPNTKTEQLAHAESIKRLADLEESRRYRLLSSRPVVHPFLWFVLVSGGSIVLGYSFMFGSPNVRAQALMTSLLAVLITTTMLLILQYSSAYLGDSAVDADPFLDFLRASAEDSVH